MLTFNLLGSIGETRTKDAQSVARANLAHCIILPALRMVLIFATRDIF